MYQKDAVIKVSIPFCIKKCPYCDREIIAGWNSERIKAYAYAVIAEIEENAGQFEDCRIIAVRFSGGTASLAGSYISEVMRAIKGNYTVAGDASITMRASSGDISGATMPFFKRAGIERFDFEMMSLNPCDFSRLNQTANFSDFSLVCDHFLHSYENNSLGLVLVYGHPAPQDENTVLNFRRSVLAFVRSHGAHLTLERYRAPDALSDDLAMQQLEEAREVLREQGFVEYADLKFAKPGCEDRFTLARQAGIAELGFGLAACTCIEGVRSINTSDLGLYLAASRDYTKITSSVELLRA